MIRNLIQEICANERITRYRLAEVIGTTPTSLTRWCYGYRKPHGTAKILLKAIHRHGLKLFLAGESSQPIEPQQNDRLKIT